jgi:putative acetyltransferase
VDVEPVSPRDPEVAPLLAALDAELDEGGYADDEQFGYSAEQLEAAGVHLVGARLDGELVGIGGVELQDDATAELKRFFVRPDRRGAGVADALLTALLEVAGERVVRLETGNAQQAALGFYRRHGFVEVPRFGPYVDSATSICMERRPTLRP